MHDKLACGLVLVAMAIVALTYWPILHGSFVWDDWESFHTTPWLTQGDLWKHYIFRDFNGWSIYFRPLVVAFFTLQVRLFDSTPGPMHAVSLFLHLIDMALVGLLAWRCGVLSSLDAQRRAWWTAGCTLLYGLHPALIESVSWIGCQFDLIATLWILLGLIVNLSIERPLLRAGTLALVFFLAACSKESAVSLPLLIVLFDWLLFSGDSRERLHNSVRHMLRRNGVAYAALLISGFLYLVFRHWAIGGTPDLFSGTTLLSQLQIVSFTYLQYWKIIVWPIDGMNPIHPISTSGFGRMTPYLLCFDIGALALVAVSAFVVIRRKSVAGGIVVAASVALLPVLHVLSVVFERSLYHERYATTAIAVICGTLPLVRWHIGMRFARVRRGLVAGLGILAFCWFVSSVATIRVVSPLWANDVNLWRWALTAYPQSSQAKDNLLKAYLEQKDDAAFHQLARRVLADTAPCAGCDLLIAKKAVETKNTQLAVAALQRAEQSRLITMDKPLRRDFFLFSGLTLMQMGEMARAEQALRSALEVDPTTTRAKEALETIQSGQATQNK